MGMQTCPACGGSGKGNTRTARAGAQDMVIVDPCGWCLGAGWIQKPDDPPQTYGAPQSRQASAPPSLPRFTQGKVKSYTGGKLLFMRHGQGKAQHRDGLLYEGRWSLGRWSGEGTLTRPGVWTYRGRFRGGMLHGKGTLALENGTTLEGRFRQSVPAGKGVLTLANGSRFEGKWSGSGSARGKYHPAGESAIAATMEGGVLTVKPGLLSRRKQVLVFECTEILWNAS